MQNLLKSLSILNFFNYPFLHLSSSLEQGLPDGLILGDGVVPLGAPQKLNLGVKEFNGVLHVKVGINRDSHEGGHGTDKSALILSGNIPENMTKMN